MKARFLVFFLVSALFLVSCQSATPPPAELPTSAGQMETQIAATIYAGQTSTVAANYANQTATIEALSPFQVALTADALTAAVRTPMPTPKPTSVAITYEFTIPASACWLNSEIYVRTGQTVIITASGTGNTNKGIEDSTAGPGGQTYICGDIECPLRGVGYGALIGRLEDLQPFFVGAYYQFKATKDGQLWFTINDWECGDNFGEFNLVIKLDQ